MQKRWYTRRAVSLWLGVALFLGLGAQNAQAGPMVTYTFTTDFVNVGTPITGAFQVPLMDITVTHSIPQADVSNFILLDLFGYGYSSPTPSFDPSSDATVKVDSSGDPTAGFFFLIVGNQGVSNYVGATFSSGAFTTNNDQAVVIIPGDLSFTDGHWGISGLTAVPEPTSACLCAVAAGCGLLFWVRRRYSS